MTQKVQKARLPLQRYLCEEEDVQKGCQRNSGQPTWDHSSEAKTLWAILLCSQYVLDTEWDPQGVCRLAKGKGVVHSTKVVE